MLKQLLERIKAVTTLTKKDKYSKAREKYVSNTGKINVWALKPFVEELLKTKTDAELAKEYYAYQGAHYKGDNMHRDALMIAMMARTRQESGPIADFVITKEGLVLPASALTRTKFRKTPPGGQLHPTSWVRHQDGKLYVSCGAGHTNKLDSGAYSVVDSVGTLEPGFRCTHSDEHGQCNYAAFVTLEGWVGQ